MDLGVESNLIVPFLAGVFLAPAVRNPKQPVGRLPAGSHPAKTPLRKPINADLEQPHTVFFTIHKKGRRSLSGVFL